MNIFLNIVFAIALLSFGGKAVDDKTRVDLRSNYTIASVAMAAIIVVFNVVV